MGLSVGFHIAQNPPTSLIYSPLIPITPPSLAKWGVETNAIKDLKDNWHMEHNFHHHPNATYALWLILFMAHNLFYAYVFRHLKSYRLYQPTMKRITEDFMSSFLHWKWRMSWIHFDGT
jgi:hypothetical protein